MLNIVLHQPQIPPNTGNIIRLCANTGYQLHLIKPYGFELQEKALRRAGLDYHEWASLQEWNNLADCLAHFSDHRWLACTTKGANQHSAIDYHSKDVLFFGSETHGLPESFIFSLPPEQRLKIPMLPHSRSLNLANSVAVIVYESWRQLGYLST